MPTRRLRALPILLALAGGACASPTVDGSVSALEGTREGYGVLRLLNDGEGTDLAFLDDTVALDRRAATNLIAHRDGDDETFGTPDDDLFDTIAEVDLVRYVGPSTLATLVEFARLNDYVPGDNAILGTFDDVEFTYLEAERVLELVNSASEADLRATGIPSRAVPSILEARPIATIPELAGLYYVGTRTLEILLEQVADPAGGEPCMDNSVCSEGFRCTGRPQGMGWGLCQDMRPYDGMQEPCDADADCASPLVCIAQTVYERGYCAYAWMRDDFEDGGHASIPAVVMTSPMGFGVTVYGQASVPEDIVITLNVTHSDPSSLWIGLQPPTGQEPVTLYDGATAGGPIPHEIVDHSIYRDDAVNGMYTLLIQNVGGRGTGSFDGFTLHVSSRWD
ncbi:MAG: hypothetical protein AB7S26_19615 [Sandaracinaceae bacterium]